VRRAALLVLMCACLQPREPQGRQDESCAWCHGDGTRPGDALTKAAPPRDVHGNTDVVFPGVGAHALHLQGGETYRAVACSGCHLVPASLSSAGHNDGVSQVVLDGGGTWAPGPRTCSGSACHKAVSGVWTRPRSSAEACGSCHGVPPPAPHPQAGACAVCHGELDAGQHVDGVVQTVTASCSACHGSADAGTPLSGAHGAHVARFACSTCHVVPAAPATETHPNGRVDVTCGTSCHYGNPPAWTSPAQLSCSGCHGAPPPVPHPQVLQCALCHPVGGERHVNGSVEAPLPGGCNGCHGGAMNAAPPRDLDGGADTARPGVGAHQAHLVDTGRARVPACSECHAVPAQLFAPGHLDGLTQVRFSGVATANGATPRYQGGSCAGSACHDVRHFTVQPGGGNATEPQWTRVDGSQVSCTSCHGQPPPAPHPARTDCAACHPGVGPLHVNGRVDFVP